jgi:gamma-glutamylcyclotransferase (GGCT)/AIG2-like uncharacterized protein YtfP
MQHDERDKTATYRVIKTGNMYSVTKYPETVTDIQEVSVSSYREDTLPIWILEAIRTLDVSGEIIVDIPTYGQKQDSAYWFFGEQVIQLSLEIQMGPFSLWHLTQTGYTNEED